VNGGDVLPRFFRCALHGVTLPIEEMSKHCWDGHNQFTVFVYCDPNPMPRFRLWRWWR